MQYNGSLFKIWANVFTLEEAYYARLNKSFKPNYLGNSIYGTCDGPFGYVYLNQSNIEQLKLDDSKTSYVLFFTVEILNKMPYEFNGASLELSILKEQKGLKTNLYTPKNVYLNCKLSDNKLFRTHYSSHKLKWDNPKHKYMYIELAANNKEIRWDLSPFKSKDGSFYKLPVNETHFLNGRHLLIFQRPEEMVNKEIYLNVYNLNKKIDNSINHELANYVFKYYTFKDKINFDFLRLQNSYIKVGNTTNKNKTAYNLKFEPAIRYNENEFVSYYIKGIYADKR